MCGIFNKQYCFKELDFERTFYFRCELLAATEGHVLVVGF
jgi:hypothetical protein